MKKILLLLLAVTICLTLCSCEALLEKAKEAVTGNEASAPPADYVSTAENELYVYEIYTSYIKVMEYLGEETEVTVPSIIDGKPVKAIGSLCFFQKGVTSVTIPESVTVIDESAFYYADVLTSITIPDTVQSIGMRAFGWCNSLESVTLGSGITEIPDYCFNHCAALTSLSIPENITKIGIRAFSYCEKLNELIIPATVTEVGGRAFTGCPALEYVSFENGDTRLGEDAFTECENVVIIAPESSAVYNYCAENSLRWSTSKFMDAIQLAPPESPDVTTDNSDSNISEVIE